MNNRPRVAWFSLLDRSRYPESRAAYFSERVIPHLAKKWDLEVFHPDFSSDWEIPNFNYLTAFERDQVRPFDAAIHHIEDGRDSWFTRSSIGTHPGIVIFHDFLLTNDGPEPILNSPFSQVVKKFHERSLPWPDRSAEFKRERPYALREAALSVLPLFMSEKDAVEYSRVRNARPCLQGVSPAVLNYPVSEELFRRNISAPTDSVPTQTFHVAYCGRPSLESRSFEVCRAVALLQEEKRNMRVTWLVRGEAEERRAREFIKEFSIEDSVTIARERSPEKWSELVLTADLALHPHFSVYGGVSPYLEISAACGCPIVVSRFGEGDNQPDSLMFKVTVGPGEAREMAGVIEHLAANSPQTLGEKLRVFALEKNHEQVIAEDLKLLVASSLPQLRSFTKQWRSFLSDASRGLLGEALTLEREAGALAPLYRSFEKELRTSFEALGWMNEGRITE